MNRRTKRKLKNKEEAWVEARKGVLVIPWRLRKEEDERNIKNKLRQGGVS